MTYKEDYMAAIRHGKPESIPFYGLPWVSKIAFMDPFEKGPAGGGYDGYGVYWEPVPGASVPSVEKICLKDITKWREQVTFPDLDAIDWEEKAARETAGLDRGTTLLEYGMGNGPFERMLAWMGYQPLIEAIIDEPEAVHELLDAWVEHRLHFVDLVCRHYRPDFITIYDDVAYERGLFLTKDMYEEFIQPAHKRVNDAILKGGALPVNHCCGKAEALVENFIAEGCVAWTSCQPMNDIAGLLDKYHNQLTIIGGYVSNAGPAMPEASEEERLAEVRRVVDSYAKNGSFILGNMLFSGLKPEERMARIDRAAAYLMSYGANYYEKNKIK